MHFCISPPSECNRSVRFCDLREAAERESNWATAAGKLMNLVMLKLTAIGTADSNFPTVLYYYTTNCTPPSPENSNISSLQHHAFGGHLKLPTFPLCVMVYV